jgi:WD40 repeat protein
VLVSRLICYGGLAIRCSLFTIGLLFFLLPSSARAQAACPALAAPPLDPSRNFFTPHQEEELGEVVRQQFESDFLVIEDEQVTGFLKRIGDRVSLQLPSTGLHYQFLLYDRPEIQAFSMPGGRIYVSRKMVAYLRNEDELAGLLGHELGHLAARQQARDLSRDFRDVLGIKSIAPDEDMFGLYNQFVESVRLKKRHSQSSGDEDKGQKVADLLGVQSVARAGYAPQAFPDFLDRLMQTKGKTGNWFTDLLGATHEDSRRLREALKDISNLPASCIAAKTPAHTEEFQKWQADVLHYKGIGHQEKLNGVISKKTLSNPLRGDISDFRFSPDGKYLLAQDESGINVLTRDPLQFVFRIDAPDAERAQFSPDSRQVVFFSSGLRVETWDVERQEQNSVTDVPALRGCRQTELSPDAKFLACLDQELALSLFNVATGETIFKKDNFFDFESGFSYTAGLYKFIYFLTHKEIATLRFSPDARYFAASSRTKEEAIIDLTMQKPIKVPGSIHTAMEYSFSFLGPDRIVGPDAFAPQKSPIVEFPSGKVVDRISLGGGSIRAASNPRYILIRPVQDFAAGVYDLEQKKYIYTTRTPATDVWGDWSVGERLNGEVGLYKNGEAKASTVLQLPLGKLGAIRAFSISPDLNYLAISTRTRGGIWDLVKNSRVSHVRSFQEAYYNSNVSFFLDFPQFEKLNREMVVVSPLTLQSKVREIDKDEDIEFFGDVYLRTKHNDKNRSVRRNLVLDVQDMASGKSLWSRTFPKQAPFLSGSSSTGKLIFLWSAKADGLRDELTSNPRLQALWTRENPGESDFFVEVLNARDGSSAGGAVVRTGKYSFHPVYEEAAGDWLAVTDNLNRVLLYSVSTGEQKAKWFGYRPHISASGDRLCLSNGRGHIAVYDLRSLKPLNGFYFANATSVKLFSGDGQRLFVLTDDQTGYVLDVSSPSATAAAAQP